METLVDVRDVPHAEGDDLLRPAWLWTVFHNHDQPVIIGGVEKVLDSHPGVFVVVFGILVTMCKPVIPLRVQRHRVDHDIGDGVDVGRAA